MSQKTVQQNPSSYGKISKTHNEDYKRCPHCYQNQIPFKHGVCICGEQVWDIQYVKHPRKYAKIQRESIDKICIEENEYDVAVEETFAGIEEVDATGYDYSEDDENDEHYCSPKCWCKNKD